MCRGHTSDLQKSQQTLFLLQMQVLSGPEYIGECLLTFRKHLETGGDRKVLRLYVTATADAAPSNLSQLTSKGGRLIC